jgi:formate-nitrite transporter family protein
VPKPRRKPQGDGQARTVQLSEREEGIVDERVAPRAAVSFEIVRREGAAELERPSASLAFSGLAAGLSMGFSLVATALLRVAVPAAAPWRSVFENLGYTVGFLIVVLGRQQLFTENTVTAILPLLDERGRGRRLVQVLRLWTIVLASNLAGAAAFAFAVTRLPVFAAPVRAAFLEIGRAAASEPFWTLLVRGIFAGWLIALMVWLLPGDENAHVPVILIITYIVGAAGLSHIIAGSVEVFTTVAAGERTWAEYFTAFFLPVFAGNTIGGVLLVSMLNYAQVAPESSEA